MKVVFKILWLLFKVCFQALVLLFAFIGFVTIDACETEDNQKTLTSFINDHYAGKKARLCYEVRDS